MLVSIDGGVPTPVSDLGLTTDIPIATKRVIHSDILFFQVLSAFCTLHIYLNKGAVDPGSRLVSRPIVHIPIHLHKYLFILMAAIFHAITMS